MIIAYSELYSAVHLVLMSEGVYTDSAMVGLSWNAWRAKTKDGMLEASEAEGPLVTGKLLEPRIGSERGMIKMTLLCWSLARGLTPTIWMRLMIASI
jgi:hypothetical protein